MDSSIRQLLSVAQRNIGNLTNTALQEAYEALHHVAQTKPTVDTPVSFGQDLYVICAEVALQHGLPEISKECLKMFFMKTPPANQFLCRAYLCQAQLLAPKTAANTDQLEKAVVYIVKAISFAKENPRYHFLVYNASVLYWQFCRPFLKPNYRQFLARSLHQVVKALDDMEDKDYEWRAMLMIALIECHLDAGRRNDASHIAVAAASFIRQNVPHLYKKVFGLMVRNQLVESAKLAKDLKNPELAVYYKICKLKLSLDLAEVRDYHLDVEQILYQLGVIQDEPRSAPDPKSKKRAASTGKGSPGVDDERKMSSKSGRRTPTPTSAKRISQDCDDKPYLLLEVGRLCLELDFADLGILCVDNIKTCIVKDPGFYLEAEFLQTELMVKRLGDKQENYMKSSVDIRLQAIRRCEEAIMNAIRQGDPNIIQLGCTTQFNLCLPLLQPNLRQHVRKPLTLVAEALEDIDSLLIQLRCQVHTELAKCDEDEEQIQVAMEHLKKALALDDGCVYQERLVVALHRLELCSQLYTQPERPEDQAAMIIEQARKANSGTIRMKRSLLVRAGEALAPDAFLLVLDSESDTKDVTTTKGPQTVINKLAGRARHFEKCARKSDGHLKRLGDENDRERAHLWADLAKTARKQEVWDVCRVAARFCLLYDDGRWKNTPPVTKRDVNSPKTARKMESIPVESDMMGNQNQVAAEEKRPGSRHGSRPGTPEPVVPLFDKDLIRMLAEVNFINGEALIHLLRSEGLQLNDKPIPPEDKSKRPKGYVAKKPEEDPDWLFYCEWIQSLSTMATRVFLRALELGTQLQESWIVCCASSYIWNYNNHILTQNRHHEIIEHLQTCLDGLKKVGHAGETMLLVNICTSLAFAYLKPWIPSGDSTSESPAPSQVDKGKKTPGPTKTKSANIAVSPDAGPDLKKAIDVCDHCLQVTNGDRSEDLVPVSVRLPLLQTWVRAKQLSQIQINKTFGTDDESNTEGQRSMTRCIVAMEMIQLSQNRIMEFKDAPTLPEMANMIEECNWTDKFIELQLWTRLTAQAYHTKMPNLVYRCCKLALRFTETGTQPKNRKPDGHLYRVEQEMFSYASCLLGQSIMDNMNGKQRNRREAMEAFLKSARHARDADNYSMVLAAARHYWNVIYPLVSQPIERELVKEPIKLLLIYITETAEKIQTAETEDVSDEDGDVGTAKPDNKAVTMATGNTDDDLSLRAALYGVLFQAYADSGDWEESLLAMDQAITDMGRSKHRLLIFKHRVMVKAKLGRHVHMDIAKFKEISMEEDEHEEYVAQMWRRIAMCSVDVQDQLQSYQQAIESLESAGSDWQKVDYLIEFGQWLYVNQFPVPDAVDVMEWAVDIILTMNHRAKETAELAPPEKTTVKVTQPKVNKKEKKKGKGKSGPTPDQQPAAHSVNQSEHKKDEKETEEINEADYIPIAKKAVIGLAPVTETLRVNDISDVRQLDSLIYLHILLAEIHGPGSHGHKESCLLAYGYLMRLWQVAITASGPVAKEIAKNQSDEPAGKSSAKTKNKDPKGKEAPKEKPKRKVPIDVIPGCVEDWAIYEIPDEMVDAFKHESMKTTGVNSSSIKKPLLTLYYLDSLITQLRQLGYNYLTLPILSFIELLSKDMLKSRPLNMLVHLRAMEICLEINLKSAANFHEKLAGGISITEEDQAESRQRVALWKERQSQFAREELHMKQSLEKLASEAKAKSSKSKSSQKSRTTKSATISEGTGAGYGSTKGDVDSHLGKVLGRLVVREIWADIGEVLLHQGMYQRAREYLSEAYAEAVAFEDTALQGRICLLLARLSLIECQYGQANTLCTLAQEVHKGDEQFWCDSVLTMVESILANYHDRSRKRKARALIVRVMNVFLDMSEEKPNRASAIGYILAKMEAKLGSIQVSITLEEHKDINVPKVMKALLSACQKFENVTEKLLSLGYRRDVMPIMREHASVLRRMAQAAIETEIQHTYYLQALAVLKDLVAVSEEVFYEAQSLCSPHELRFVSLPVQRELAYSQQLCGEIMLDIYALHVAEERAQKLEDQRKGTVLRMVEDLVRETPDYTQMEKEWSEIAKVIAEGCLTQLINSHNLSRNTPKLKAASLCYIGRCLRLLSLQKHPDPPSQWLVREMEMLKVAGNVEEEGEGAAEDGEDLRDDVCPKSVTALIEKQKDCKYYLQQATECLSQAVNLALASGVKEVASKAALELVECLGQYDMAAASQYLALYQSCESALNLEKVLYKSQPDPTSSRLAALLHQRAGIQKSDITSNTTEGSVAAALETALEQDWQAWKQLSVLPNHVDFLKEFPANFNFFVLQHSPDRKKLYGALMDKSKGTGGSQQNAGGKGDSKKAAMQGLSRARIACVETNPDHLEDLIERFRSFKHSTQQSLLQQEYVRSQQAQRQKMLENLDDSMKQDVMTSPSGTPLEEEGELQDEFLQLLEEMESYLRPVLTTLDGFLRPQTATTASNGTTKDTPNSHECLILLADADLLEMPLEALQILQSENISSLSRDYSLQFFYHRHHLEVTEDVTAGTGKKPKADKGKDIPPRIPGLKDANKKQAKIIPLNRQLLPWCQPVDTMNFRFMVDPYLDCDETETSAPVETMKQVLEEYEQLFTPRWLGVMGDDHVPSVGEWEIYLSEGSSFVYYGMEGFLSNIPANKMSSLNIPDCMITYILDMAQTSKSFLRQSKIDVLKDAALLQLEKPVEKAMLVSLAGVKCVMANQWHCTLQENYSKFRLNMKDMLTEGLPTGQATRLLFTPYRRKIEVEEEGEGTGGETARDKASEHGSQSELQQQVSEDAREEVLPESAWYNMVCYGLPNLVVTQI